APSTISARLHSELVCELMENCTSVTFETSPTHPKDQSASSISSLVHSRRMWSISPARALSVAWVRTTLPRMRRAWAEKYRSVSAFVGLMVISAPAVLPAQKYTACTPSRRAAVGKPGTCVGVKKIVACPFLSQLSLSCSSAHVIVQPSAARSGAASSRSSCCPAETSRGGTALAPTPAQAHPSWIGDRRLGCIP